MFFSFTILGVAAHSGGFLRGFLFSCSFVLIYTSERNSCARQTFLCNSCAIQVCGAELYESGSIAKDQDFLSPKILLSAFSDQKDYKVNFGYEALLWRVALKSGACDKFCSMWRSRKAIRLKCGHFKTIMFCHMDSDLERNLQSKFSLCLFPSKSDARFMEACEST